MEGLTEIPEKMTVAEFEDLYARALSRLRRHEKRTAAESLVRSVVKEEAAKGRGRRIRKGG